MWFNQVKHFLDKMKDLNNGQALVRYSDLMNHHMLNLGVLALKGGTWHSSGLEVPAV